MRRVAWTAVPLIALAILLVPTGAAAKGKPGGGDGCTRDIWAFTPNLYETADNGGDPAGRLVVPAGGGEVTVARFQVDAYELLRGQITVDGFQFSLLQGTPGGITFRVYALTSGLNCYNREIYATGDFMLYGSATPTTSTFSVDNVGTDFPQDVAPHQFCVFVTAQDAGATPGEVHQLGIDYSYTTGSNRKALNADCRKYQDYGLSNDKSFFRYGSEGPAPARTFVEFVVQ